MSKKHSIKSFTIILYLFLSVVSTNICNSQTVDSNSNDNLQNVKYQLISAQKEISELYDKNFIYKSKIKELEDNYKKLKMQESILEQKLISKESEIEKLSSEASSFGDGKCSKDLLYLRNLLSQREEEINKLRQQSNNRQQELTLKENEFKRLSSEFISSGDQSSKDLLYLRNLLSQKEEEIIKLRQQSNSKQQELFLKEEELEKSLIWASKKINKLKEDNAMLSTQIQKINTISSSQINKLNSLIYKANNQITSLKNKKCSNFEEKIIKYLTQNNAESYISYYSIARAYHDRKNYKIAIKHYSKCLKINPYFKPANLYLGIAYAENNDKKNTFKVLNNYLKTIKDKKEREIISNYISLLKSKS